MPAWLKPLLARIHPEVLSRYCGFGLVCPPLLEGCRVLDLGCGSGRDVYALAQLVGERGEVVGSFGSWARNPGLTAAERLGDTFRSGLEIPIPPQYPPDPASSMMSFPAVDRSSGKKIAVADLVVGMYVGELDRPWLGTPFMLQGFLIEAQSQIDQLRANCRFVFVDPRRSVVAIATAPEAAAGAVPPASFIDVARRLRQRPPPRRRGQPPAVSPEDNESALEEEMLYSAPLVDDTHTAVKQLMQSIELDEKLDIKRVSGQVKELAESVARNPDALVWLSRLRQTDDYTYDHAIEVSIHLMVFAQFIGMDPPSVERLGLVGLLQDVGKIHLPPEILSKQERLSDEEYLLIRSHVGSSLELLVGQALFDRKQLEVVARHHERHDGSGYPRNLKGEKIGLLAEMAGLIDTFCAMTRHRPYGEAVSNQQALSRLVGLRGTKFRDALIDQFIQCMGLYPVGTLVELNSGEVAVVIQKNQVRRLKPKLLLLLGPDKKPDRRPRTLDLLLEPLTPTGEPYRIATSLPATAYGIDPREFYLD